MPFLRKLSKILILTPIAMLIHDIVKEWFVNARFKIQDFKEWLAFFDESWPSSVRPVLQQLTSGSFAESIMTAPGPLVMAVPPVILYVIYRIIFALQGGQRGGTFTFKSHD